MCRLFIFLNILLVIIATTTSSTEHNPKPKPKPNQKPHNFVLPVLKTTNEDGFYYYTNVSVGKPPLVVSLNIDFSSRALWFECEKTGYNSTTYTPVPCGSSKCKQAKGDCSKCYGPVCRYDTCISPLFYGLHAALLEDYVTLSHTSPSAHVAPKLAPRMPLACIGTMDYHPVGTQGILGLTNGSISFVNRLVSTYKIPFKVALCLPSKHGVKNSGHVYIGGGPYVLPPNGKDVSRLFVSTPLIHNTREGPEDVYYIDLKSIEVNGKRIPFKRDQLTFNKSTEAGGTMIINTRPYTYLESSIYKAILKAFAQNATKAKAVDPFSDCFSSASFGGEKTPVISLVLGGGAKWNIYGPNSLVKVNKSVTCLAFLDSGESRTAITIGNYQMEDNLVEFDLEASKFSITSSLLLHNTSCSRRL